jgi:hypothetical protein
MSNPRELEPREQVLQLVVDAAVLLRHAVMIAEGLPDVGYLPAELRDAVGITAQATTRLLEGRERGQYEGVRAATLAEVLTWRTDP